MQMRNASKVMVGKPEGKRPLTRPWHRLKDRIKADFWETKLDDVDWIHVAQDSKWGQAFVNTVFK